MDYIVLHMNFHLNLSYVIPILKIRKLNLRDNHSRITQISRSSSLNKSFSDSKFFLSNLINSKICSQHKIPSKAVPY